MDKKQALNKVAGMCAMSEQCRYDIEEKLKKWELTADEISDIIAYLYKDKFLDDARYVRTYVKDKLRFNKWGRKKIEYMLAHKGLKGAVVKDILDEEINGDISVLTELLKAKRRTLKSKDEYDEKAKLYRFAAGRGFSGDEISKALRALNISDED